MLRSALMKSLLLFALLFAQQGLVLHGFSHGAHGHEQSQGDDQRCNLCAASAQVGHAPGSTELRFEFAPAVAGFIVAAVSSFHFRTTAPFEARAPPLSA